MTEALVYRDPLADKHIALGVSGSIAAYKALSIASQLTQAGAQVDTILTSAAGELVRPLAFRAITHREVVSDLWASGSEMAMDHVALAHRAQALLVAPATADRIAKLSLGLAEDALGSTALACPAPLLLAPAMEPNMWSHPATQEHVARLDARGATWVGPEEGRMASGKRGLGRMAEPARIVDALRAVLARGGPLAGRRVLITAGPTREAIDPVRFLSNRSTGSMGLALARVARDLGAEVRLVHGPVPVEPMAGLRAIPVESALEMQAAVEHQIEGCDLLVMTAAVADYRPAEIADRKIKKQPGDMQLRLARNPDILVGLRERFEASDRPRPFRIGFAAETEDLEVNARGKLDRKGLDLVVANAVPASFGPGPQRVLMVEAGTATPVQAADKLALAQAILQRACEALQQRAGRGEAGIDGT